MVYSSSLVVICVLVLLQCHEIIHTKTPLLVSLHVSDAFKNSKKGLGDIAQGKTEFNTFFLHPELLGKADGAQGTRLHEENQALLKSESTDCTLDECGQELDE